LYFPFLYSEHSGYSIGLETELLSGKTYYQIINYMDEQKSDTKVEESEKSICLYKTTQDGQLQIELKQIGTFLLGATHVLERPEISTFITTVDLKKPQK
jgi:hypothetical protein